MILPTNIILTWSINEKFKVPAFISIASFKKHINLPVIIYYDGEISQEIETVFKGIGPDISFQQVQEHTIKGDYEQHIKNRFTRFDIAKNSDTKTTLMIDADIACNEGVKDLIRSIEEDRKKHPTKAIVWGVVEYEHAAEAWLYFNKTNKAGVRFKTPPDEKKIAFAQVFGPNWEQLVSAPQFNNGILAFHNGSALSETWKDYYLKGLSNSYVNPLDDQVPLAVALEQEDCKTIHWPNAYNSKGKISGDYSIFHAWAGQWVNELFKLENDIEALSDYAKIAQEFWGYIPNSWKVDFLNEHYDYYNSKNLKKVEL